MITPKNIIEFIRKRKNADKAFGELIEKHKTGKTVNRTSVIEKLNWHNK